MSAMSLAAAQEQFTATLSAVEDAVKFAFRRRLRPQEYEEALAEARAAAWTRLARPGRAGQGPGRGRRPRDRHQRDPLGPGPAQGRQPDLRPGRHGRVSPQGAGDVRVHARQPRLRRRVDAGDSTRGSWREWLAEDNRVTPADEAAFRLDFEGWLAGLPPRKRGSRSCWPRGTRGSSWPARSGSRRRGSPSSGPSWRRAGGRSRGRRLTRSRARSARGRAVDHGSGLRRRPGHPGTVRGGASRRRAEGSAAIPARLTVSTGG